MRKKKAIVKPLIFAFCFQLERSNWFMSGEPFALKLYSIVFFLSLDVDINDSEAFSKLDSSEMISAVVKDLKYFTKQDGKLANDPFFSRGKNVKQFFCDYCKFTFSISLPPQRSLV